MSFTDFKDQVLEYHYKHLDYDVWITTYEECYSDTHWSVSVNFYKDEISTTMTYTVALEPTQEMTAYKLASLLKTELEEILGVKYEFVN